MPRKEKLSVREGDICRRLRKFREWTKIPRTVFSSEAGIVGTRLLNCELGLTPVSYGLFRAVNSRFRIRPEFLVYGRGTFDAPAPFDEGEWAGKINPRDLLSDVCDRLFKTRFELERKEAHRSAPVGNNFAADLLELHRSLHNPEDWEGVSETKREKAILVLREIVRKVFSGGDWAEHLEEIRALIPPEKWPVARDYGL